MPLETGTYIDDLVTTNPVGASDAKSFGDDHIRLIKTVLKNSFPNIDGAVNFTPTQANNWFTTGLYNSADSTVEFVWAEDTAAVMQAIFYKNSASPAADDYIFSLDGYANNSAAEKTLYTRWLSRINDPTNGSEDAEAFFQTMVAGVLTTRIELTPTDIEFDGVPISAFTNFPSGTRMIFQQTAAPTGWTKDTTHNNKALRLVSGSVSSGGTVAFTTAFASKSVAGTVGATALTTAQMPAHTHSVSGTTSSQSANHSHSFSDTATTSSSGSHSHSVENTLAGSDVTTGVWESGPSGSRTTTSSTAGAHTHSVTVSGNTGSNSVGHTHTFSDTSTSVGSGSTHTHTFTGTAIDLAVQYVDFIIAERD